MKKSHIILLILLVVALGVVLSLVLNTANYETFKTAFEKTGEKVTVIGRLNLNKKVDESIPNQLTFYMTDKDGVEKKVILSESKPQDFEKSEELVITGIADKDSDTFMATHMLMKCPSKYKDNQEVGSK
ncbi:MAG: cytochrome c maturation protein CcmE [Crocinitomicaceae bacterium]|nr:cytochrome c maturation protein CcmE [Crocinitomicaceae bacterium]